jgi:POT family proton-dependent oligopeptide transporter
MYLLALVEMCQRFAFWGIGNLLVLYLVQYHQMADAKADNLFGIFTGVAFVLPLLGGFIADRLGYRTPLLVGCVAMAIGCFLIASGSLTLLYIALLCIALGGCVFTPCVYALLGHVYHDRQNLREGGFSIYYCSVNIGIFLAMFVLGYIGQMHSWALAFVIAGCVQLLGIWPFLIVMRSPVLATLALEQKAAIKKPIKHPALTKHEKSRLLVICVLALFSIVFWAAYNQGGSSLTLFALRYTDRNLWGFQMPPSWLFSAEPLYLVIFAIPLTSLYVFLHRRKLDPSPPMKSALGLIAMALCFLVMVFASLGIPSMAQTGSVSPLYLLWAFAFMALGEMLITPIGLALITHLSPRRFTALLVGVWYCCIGIGFYAGGLLAGLMTKLHSLTQYFNIYIVLTLVPALFLFYFAKKLNTMRHAKSLK